MAKGKLLVANWLTIHSFGVPEGFAMLLDSGVSSHVSFTFLVGILGNFGGGALLGPAGISKMEEKEVGAPDKLRMGGREVALSSSALGDRADRILPIVFDIMSSSSESDESNPVGSMTGLGELNGDSSVGFGELYGWGDPKPVWKTGGGFGDPRSSNMGFRGLLNPRRGFNGLAERSLSHGLLGAESGVAWTEGGGMDVGGLGPRLGADFFATILGNSGM